MDLRRLYFAPFACVMMCTICLSGCASWFEAAPVKTVKAKTVKHAKRLEAKADASRYIESLTLAQEALVKNPVDMASIALPLSRIQTYMAQANTKAQLVMVVVFDYGVKDSNAQPHAIAPISLAEGDFPSVGLVLKSVTPLPYILENIRVLVMQPMPNSAFTLPEEPLALAEMLNAQQGFLLTHYSRLTPKEEITAHMALLTYFTNHRQQDAAYLTLENTKQLLATATQTQSLDEASLASFSANLNQMEGQLKRALPYTF